MHSLEKLTVVPTCDVSATRFNRSIQKIQRDQWKQNVFLPIGLVANTRHLDLLLSSDSVICASVDEKE